jgi:hypothetical protein
VSKLFITEPLAYYEKLARKYKGPLSEGYEFMDYIDILSWNDEEAYENQRRWAYAEFTSQNVDEINWEGMMKMYQMRL